ncbi:hypothetical protein [Novipirellula artificiosorum]|uniref:Uncharacterized protein n=1 Tax=Novipirellula artificiosorum TaxID=2528016 RepID=A0A5C6CW88_9BACT|nr:hypothetical protein [Novipirellula artificiosorum]TWU27974.1 hypothetical protein Poly41_69970 [Novipirellula artificiosorum]
MIPALLSCIFVAYLYHSLKSENSAGDSSVSQNDQTIEARLRALSLRVEKLANRIDQGGES